MEMIHSRMKTQAKKGICKQRDVGKSAGKGKNSGSLASKEKCIETSTEVFNNVLTFPLLKTIDRDSMLPKYASVLKRSVEEGVTMDDLDALQLELEALLSAVVVRSRVLCKEINSLNCVEEKIKKGNAFSKVGLMPGKRSSINEKFVKRFKDDKTREVGSTPISIKFTKVRSISVNSNSSPNMCLPECEPDKSVKVESTRLLQPRYDAPNKFWSSVDPYCSDITQDDIKFLEELVKECGNDVEYHKIPPLGRHYSLRWAQEDLMTEQEEAHSEPKNKSKTTFDSQALLKKGEKSCEGLPSSPLTQRLVSALMDENIKIHSNDKSDSKLLLGSENNNVNGGSFRNYANNYSVNFERKVRKELEGQGIFEVSGQSKEGNDDEILQEIKRCQSELQALNNFNQTHLKRLISLAQIQMTRQELKRKLREVDNEIIENYRNIVAAKQKKRIFTKTDVDLCWKYLKERELLIKQLDTM